MSQRNVATLPLCYDTKLTSTAERDKDKTFLLPDRNTITVSAERFRCVEVLYQPSFIGKEACGIHDTSFHDIMKCDVYFCKSYADAVLSSGTNMFQEKVERMTKELPSLTTSTMKVKVVAPPE